MMLFDCFKKRSEAAMPEPEFVPCVGIPGEELVAALALIDTLGPEIDRRVLRVDVKGIDLLEITTGEVTGPLAAHTDNFVLRRHASGWQIVDHLALDS